MYAMARGGRAIMEKAGIAKPMTFKESLKNLKTEFSTLKSTVSQGWQGVKNSVKTSNWIRSESNNAVSSKIAPRSPELGTHTTMAELLKTKGIPSVEGVVITDKTIRFSDIGKLSHDLGLEYILTRENNKFILRSGGSSKTWSPPGVRPIAHTHPTDIFGYY